MIKTVFAVGRNLDTSISHAIFGKDDGLPWSFLKEDLERFKEITKNSVLIMGKATFKSLPSKLKNRFHVVLANSSDELFTKDGSKADYRIATTNLQQAIDFVKGIYPDKDICIIGGVGLINESIIESISDEVYVSLLTSYHNFHTSDKPIQGNITIDLGTLSLHLSENYTKEILDADILVLNNHPEVKRVVFHKFKRK